MKRNYDIKDIRLAGIGKKRIDWAGRQMNVLAKIRNRFKRTKPLKGYQISCCLHVTTETANLMITLKAGGAKVYLCASNPLSTQDDVAAALVKFYNVPVYAFRGEGRKPYYQHINSVLKVKPDIVIDDGADLIATAHKKRIKMIGGTEETTTGVIRLRSLERKKKLAFPVIAVNDSMTKHLFDNRYGTGQSTIDGILRATNVLISGLTFVVCGYGWCGRGIAMRAKGMGGQVIICEVDPIRALEARMDGFQVMELEDAAKLGDIFVTATGDIRVITKKHFLKMKDGVILANAGHFDVEIDKGALKKIGRGPRKIRTDCEEYRTRRGRRIYLLAEGRLVNLAAAEGHPASVMDLSFANQALASHFLIRKRNLKPGVYRLPEVIDNDIARLKLQTMGIKIDRLTREQKEYLSSWEIGT